jgi:hypothetical protein
MNSGASAQPPLLLALALNEAIYALLVELNDRPLRSWGRSRRGLFEELDYLPLTPLPDEPYEYAEWKRCRVNQSPKSADPATPYILKGGFVASSCASGSGSARLFARYSRCSFLLDLGDLITLSTSSGLGRATRSALAPQPVRRFA